MSYHPIIGLEIHVQLNTATKLFCRCHNEYVPDEPNKNICIFCTGQPGALPVLNKEAVKKAILFGVAVNGNIPKKTRWDRKNYFYPDSPSGYQISQYDNPIVEGGRLELYVEIEGEKTYQKTINLTRAHLEGDAGKSLHVGEKTLVDFNRSGCPLIEIVSEPEIRNQQEAMAYASEIQLLVRSLGISGADMEKGQMRFDCNLSLQNDEEFESNKLPGYKVEIKNMNSIRSLGRAIEYEVQRQKELLDSGKMPDQETRGWRDDLNKSTSQRSKEDAHDYRYFPEPDLQILTIGASDVPSFDQLPVLPSQKRQKYLDLGLNLATSNVFVTQKEVGELFDQILENSQINENKAITKTIANLINVNLLALANKNNCPINQVLSQKQIVELAELFEKREISNQGLSKAIELLVGNFDLSVAETVNKNGLKQVNDDGILLNIVTQVLDSNPEVVAQYKSGKVQVIGFLVGNCMKQSKGQGNPERFKDLLIQELGS